MHRAFDTAGALIGVLLSAVLLWWLTGTPQKTPAGEALNAAETPEWVYRLIFGVGAFLGLASLVLTFFVRESEPVPTQSRSVMARTDQTSGRTLHQGCRVSPIALLCGLRQMREESPSQRSMPPTQDSS